MNDLSDTVPGAVTAGEAAGEPSANSAEDVVVATEENTADLGDHPERYKGKRVRVSGHHAMGGAT